MISYIKHAFIFMIASSFIIPYFSPHAYDFCPSNPENGFICYCIYKDNVSAAKKQDLVYSSGVKKQIESKFFNGIVVLSIEDNNALIRVAASETAIFEVKPFYNSISHLAPERPT